MEVLFNLAFAHEHINNASSFNKSLNLTMELSGSFSTMQCNIADLSWNYKSQTIFSEFIQTIWKKIEHCDKDQNFKSLSCKLYLVAIYWVFVR